MKAAAPRPAARRRPAASPALDALAAATPAGTEPPRRERRQAARHAAILDAALAVFSRAGLHGATMEAIADAADVSKTNLFYYFASKEEIYVAVLRRLLDGWLAPLRAMARDDDPVEAIAAYIRRKVEFSRDHPDASRLFCLEIVAGAPLIGPALRTTLRTLVDEKAAVIRGWMDAGRLQPLDPHHLIFAIWSTTQHYADFAPQVDLLTGQSLQNPAYCEQVVSNVQQLILGALRPRS